ncbi:MAG: dephospho-CoA kinase, partial [FCB group bacterium]|nr:dephospho-CoA kinase [FCB group bacterium]
LLAFQDESSRNKLNRLVHPYLLKELKKQIKKLSHKKELIAIDAALLLDWNLDKIVDLVLMIHASQKLRLKRLSERGISKKDALARQRQQLSYRQFRERSDLVIFNNKTPEQLQKKLEKIIKKEVIQKIDI